MFSMSATIFRALDESFYYPGLPKERYEYQEDKAFVYWYGSKPAIGSSKLSLIMIFPLANPKGRCFFSFGCILYFKNEIKSATSCFKLSGSVDNSLYNCTSVTMQK